MDIATLKKSGYIDTSFAHNIDHVRQLGCIFMLRNEQNLEVPIFFKLYKFETTYRSVMFAKLIPISDILDWTYTLNAELSNLLNQRIHLNLFKDTKDLFHVNSRASTTSETRIMLEFAYSREGFYSGTISNIGLVRSKEILATGLDNTMFEASLCTKLQSSTHTPQRSQ